MSLLRIAGVDGCPGGWVAVRAEIRLGPAAGPASAGAGDAAGSEMGAPSPFPIRLAGPAGRTGHSALTVHLTALTIHAVRLTRFAELFESEEAPQVVAVDMPIGLPARTGARGRAPERLVRPLLGERQSSVFSIPSRAAVEAGVAPGVPEDERYRNACAIARATSETGRAVAKQGFHIFPKIAEIDALLRERRQLVDIVYECHPEVVFWAMNGGAPLPLAKKVANRPHPPGLEFRRKLLEDKGFPPELVSATAARALRVGPDDLVDAAASAWTACRIAAGVALGFPDPPERDAHGMPIAIRV
ncbi:DUF429 domain-containing protein [Ancylobacter terrae]|uniref:DUF429 domain-containing protein n=1 Tax=Ancylobacter sp. sgz301288 TaxID=3342077 RepID=UPI0038589E6A